MQPEDPARTAMRLGHDVIPGSARTAGQQTVWAEAGEEGTRMAFAGQDGDVRRAPADAAELRRLLPNLQPVPLGKGASAGFGDRLGVATPGHVDAMRACGAEGSIGAIFAQQSMRENSRTGRTPQSVLDDATIGAFISGWQHPVGADADHLKSPEDIDLCLAAGYSFYTVDPGDHVDAGADSLSGAQLGDAFSNRVPWQALETTPADLRSSLGAASLRLDTGTLDFGPGDLERAAVKYGAAIAHVARMARHLQARADFPVELEVSVDETPTPTTHAEHWYIASEMHRLGISWVSLAPRFIGSFEKGVEYLGDLAALARDLQVHAAIAREFGDYKLSLHSGSDKFAVYPIAAEATRGKVHLKTAGTSYLEALRVVANTNPQLFLQVVGLGREHFARDVATYLISGTVAGMPDPDSLPGSALAALLEQPDARQVLHVTFGTALRQHGAEIMAELQRHPAAYRAALRRHFERHLAPLADRRQQ